MHFQVCTILFNEFLLLKLRNASAQPIFVISPRLSFNADGSFALEENLQNTSPFMDFNTIRSRVIQQHLVEFASTNLPSLRALMRIILRKPKRFRQLSVLVYKLYAILPRKMTATHLVEHTDSLQYWVRERYQRLADMETRKVLALE